MPHPKQASWLRTWLILLALAGWSCLALWPAARLVAILAVPATAAESHSTPDQLDRLVRLVRDDSELHRLAANSLGLGLAAGAIGAILAWSLAVSAARRPGRAATAFRILTDLPECCPPLAFAVGALMVPEVVRAAADGLGSSSSALGLGLRGLADALDTYRTPGVLLTLVMVALALPALRRAAALGLKQTPPLLSDAARTLGASPLRARRTVANLWFFSTPGAALVLTMALAATSLAPALILAPTSAARPVSPGVLLLFDEPGGLLRAAILAVGATAVNLIAFALASRHRAGSLGEWFRG